MTIHWDLVEERRQRRAEDGHRECKHCLNTDRRRYCMLCDYTGYEEEPPEDESDE